MKLGECNTNNKAVRDWIQQTAELCKPDRLFWCDGSKAEKEALTAEAVKQGILIPLNQQKLPGCYYHRSHPNDVARVEQCTYVCTESEEEVARCKGERCTWCPI
jgi:phosphoenolpyruvate carboxykinase (GTP)